MKTSAFLSLLRGNAALPLVFRSGHKQTVPAGYHLTEVKRVAYETMDCGALTHRWTENQFELWAPPLIGALPGRVPMSAGKFLGIIERVAKENPLDDQAEARIHAVLGDHPAALYDIGTATPSEGRLWVELTPDRTRCKAVERRVSVLTGGCCGIGTTTASSAPVAADCGCDQPTVESREKSRCCA